MDFVLMLTRQDRTIRDSLAVLDAIAPFGLGHVGFKDVGVTAGELAEINRRIQAMGALSYLEVVSPTPEAAVAAARIAAELGIDRLLGGTEILPVLRILEGSRTGFFPFPGRPFGHPTRLAGTAAQIEADCSRFVAEGCAGADLLAFRATEADPLELVRAARRGLGAGMLIVAGSVGSPERVRQLALAGADAFTIGSAVFDGSFAPEQGLLHSQLEAVLAACASAA
jgi:hypothetical protein